MATGAVSAMVLIYISPTIQEDVLGNATSLFPLKNPALVSMPHAFATGIVVSLLRPEPLAEERTRKPRSGSTWARSGRGSRPGPALRRGRRPGRRGA
jgi:Na+(H+)/acetate symporter ActP